MSHTDCTNRLVEHGLEALLCEGGTLQVLHGSNVLSHRYALRVLNWCHAPKRQTESSIASVGD